MLPLRYAALLAVAVVVTCLWLAARDAGYAMGPLQERLATRCGDFGLYGYAIVLHLRAAEEYSSAEGGAARAKAAESLERAARLMERHVGADAAAAALRRATELDPTRTDLQVELLQGRIAAGDGTAGDELFSLAFKRENPDALRAIAEDYRAQGNAADALGCLRHAAQVAPQRHAIRLSLARLYRETGDTEGAKVEAAAAEALAATSEQAAAAREILRQLGEPTPGAEGDLWRERRDRYLLPALVLVGFLLVVFSPCLVRRATAVAGRLGRGSSPPTQTQPSTAE